MAVATNRHSLNQDVLDMAEAAHDEIARLAGSIRALERELEVALARRRVELH